MRLVGNWLWRNKKLFLLILFFFQIIFAKRFYLEEFLTKKGYQKLGSSNFTSEVAFQKKNLRLLFKPFNKFYSVNQHTYFLEQVPFYDEKGLVITQKDIELFEKVLAFYEKQEVGDFPNSSSNSDQKPNQKFNQNQNVKKKASSKLENSQVEKSVNNYSQKKVYPFTAQKNAINYLFLDPGHGGRDPGAVYYGFKEKDLTLKLTLRLAKLLKERLKNVKIILTRKTDKYLSLEKRTHLANSRLKENDNGLFISTHLNIWFDPETRGLEVYYLGDDQAIFDRRVEDIYLLENNIHNHEHSIDYFRKIFSFFKVTQFQNESRYLAEKIISQTFLLVRDYPITRGVKKEIFYVLNGALMPAVLIELGFISNRQDLEFLFDEKKSEQLLTSIAKAIGAYIKEFNNSNGFRDELFLLQ